MGITREELYKLNNYDLDKTKEAWNFLTAETGTCSVGIAILGTLIEKERVDGKVHLILKNGVRTGNLTKIRSMNLSLEDIKGISIPLATGGETIVWPQWEEKRLLKEGVAWKGPEIEECEALYFTKADAVKATKELEELGSEAVKYIRKVAGDSSYLPGFVEAGAIMAHIKEYNDIAELIQGAKKLPERGKSYWYLWTSTRRDTNYAWFFGGGSGCANGSYFCGSLVALGCLL